MNAIPRWLVAVFVAMILTILGAGVWFYHNQRGSARQDAAQVLESIARLKLENIIWWRENQLEEAREFMSSRFLLDGVARWFSTPRAELSERILGRFRRAQSRYHYVDVLLLDTEGRVRLSLSRRKELPPEILPAVKTALGEHKAVLMDLRADNDSVLLLEVVAPLFTGDGAASKPIGAIVLQNDARKTLYPMVQSWPVPSRTAETLLVRRDGDTALFLNELRHRQDAALKLRIPLAQTNVPAVMAVLGTEGVVEGEDYRSIAVLSVLKHIPDSTWWLVVKQDAAEIFAAWRFRSLLILGLIFGCVVVVIGGIEIVWQRNLKAHYRTLFHAETAQREAEKLYRALFDNMLNGFVHCRMIYEQDRPRDFVFLAVNNAFGSLTGLKDVIGKRASEVIPGIWEKDAALLEIYGRVAQTGAPEKFETYVDSMKMWFSVSAYRSQEGHFMAVFDAITRRKQTEQALCESEERYRLLADNAEDFVALNDTQGNRLYVSPSYFRVTGWMPEEIHQTSWRTRVHPEDLPVVEQARQDNLAGQITTIEHRVHCRDGSWIWVEARCKPVLGTDGKVERMLVWSRDITARKRAELALRESETLLRSISDHAEDMIFIKDRDSRYLFMNPAGLRLADLTLEQIVGRTDLEWSHYTAEAAKFMAADRRVISSGQGETFEEEITTAKGVKRVFLVTKTPRLDAEGNVIGVVGVCHDITGRKRAEEALRKSEKRFRTLYVSMTEVVALHEIVTAAEGQAVDYRLLDCNLAFTKVTGISHDRAIGALASELYGTGEAPYLDIYARVATTGEPATFEAFFAPMAKHFEISVFSPQRGRFAIVAGDITVRKLAERRLAKQQTLLEGINRVLREAIRCETERELADKCLAVAQELTASQFGFVCESNATGTADSIALTNPGWNACTMPQSEAAVLLKNMPLRGIWANPIRTGEPAIVNDPASHPDHVGVPTGHPPIHRFLGVPLKIGDKTIGVIGLANKASDYDAEDLQGVESVATAFVEALQRLRARQQMRALNAFLDRRVQERTNQLETANSELESFSYSVSHDLRAPLRAISGFAGILAEDHAQRLDEDGRRVVGTISSEAKRMGQLIDDLLAFSRAGRRPLEAMSVDMSTLAKAAYDECSAQAPGRNIQFKLHPLPPAQGDTAMLRQVWANLISNAVKYTRRKPVAEIEIAAYKENGELVYSVKDNGTGFDMQYAQKLFGVFQRLHSEQEYEGTGVGLALVQRVVRRHGGRIWAKATLNEGATFCFSLPVRKE